MLINGGRVRIWNCKYEINAATRAGGAVSVTKGSLEMADSSIISNYAGEADGMRRCYVYRGAHKRREAEGAEVCVDMERRRALHTHTE